MKKMCLIGLFVFLLYSMPANIQAETITFDLANPPGISYTPYSNFLWLEEGGGHLEMMGYTTDDTLYFDNPVFLNDFQLNGLPVPGYSNFGAVYGPYHMRAFDNNNNEVWRTTVSNLSEHATWDNWLTVSVNADNVSSLVFYSPWGGDPDIPNAPWDPSYDESKDMPYSKPLPDGVYRFWPSLDNININNNPQVPEPATMALLGSLIFGIGFAKRKRS